VPGALVVGDGVGGASTVKARLLRPNQIGDTKLVKANSDGLFDLNGHSEAIGRLELYGGSVTTGAGKLTLNGDVTVTAFPSWAAKISGKLDLGTAARTFTVNAGTSVLPDVLVVQGDISAPAGLIKAGAGKLVVQGPNASKVAATVNDGTLRLDGEHTNTTVLLNRGVLEARGKIQSLTTGTDAIKTVYVGTRDSIGTLQVTGAVALSASTTFELKTKGGNPAQPGADFDRLTAGGQVSLNGAQLKVVAEPGFKNPLPNTHVQFITGTVAGDFSNVPRTTSRLLEVRLPDGRHAFYRVDYPAGGVDLNFRGVLA
jgi:hypothetical protein